MPRRRYNQKRYRRKKRRGNAMPHFSRPRGIAPRTYTTVLRYSQQINNIRAGATSNIPGRWIFRMNSCYDPDYTGTVGEQPCFFDLLAARFAQYCVTRVRVTVKVVSYNPGYSSGSAGSGYVGLFADDNITNQITTAQKWSAARDAGSLTYKKYEPIYGAGKNGTVIRQVYSMWRLLGYVSNAAYLADLTNHADVGSNPTPFAALNVYVGSPDITDVTTTWLYPLIDVTLEQEVTFSDNTKTSGWDVI